MDSLAKRGRKIKDMFREGKHKPGKPRPDSPRESADSPRSFLRPESGIKARSYDGGRSGSKTPDQRACSRAVSPLPGPTPGSWGGDRREAEASADGKGVNQGDLRPDLDVHVTVGSGPGQGAKQVQPSPLPPPRQLSDDTDASAISDYIPKGIRSNKGTGPAAALPEKTSDWAATASATAKLLLRGVRDSADGFGPLKTVAGGLCFILDNCERTKENEQSIESLAPRLKALSESLCSPPPEDDVEEQERRKKLDQKFQDFRQDLAVLGEQGIVKGFLNNVENANRLSGLVEDIRDAVMAYQTSLQQGLYDRSSLLIDSADAALLDRMYRTPNAGYRCGNRQGCLRGTREDVLREIDRWLVSDKGQRAFWLNGLAGTGKSTIAQTFAERTFADGKLGASFFCSRDFTNRCNIQVIFPTIAYQLAYHSPQFRKELLKVLKTCPDVEQESLCSQMKNLIVGPLKAAHVSTLIIIDALDECRDEEPASAILSVLSRYTDEIPNVKFFITGRPEPRIRSGFRLKSLRPITEVFKLHDVKRSSVDSDIRLFFRTKLADIAKTRSDCNLTSDWPSPSDVDTLCAKAAGFFIYASTVTKIIAHKHRTPAEQLERIISLPQSTTQEGRSGIDLLYTQVLEQAVADVDIDDEDDEEIHGRFKTVVGTVLLVFDPLSAGALSDLLKTPSIPTTLRHLHSLFLIPDGPEEPIRAFHKSLPDFITDDRRCKDKRFFVDPAICHGEILISCLNLMEERLKKNICNLDDFAVLSEVEDLSIRQNTHIGATLEYTCKFWTNHLLKVPSSSSRVKEVQNKIDKFFTIHLLHWIEVLALTGNLGVGVYAMNEVKQWYELMGITSNWASDSQRFLLEHFEIIHKSPSQIYHSALPLSPSSSFLHKFYIAKLSQIVKGVKGVPVEWGMCSRTVLLDSCTVALSHHNNSVAVASGPRVVILNRITGNQVAIFSGHRMHVASLMFSSDGTSLVSGSYDKTTKLWDVQTGGIIKTFSGPTDRVLDVSISADSTLIASGSADCTIHLWDTQTGGLCCVIRQGSIVTHARFSPIDPQCLMSASGNQVWQWNTNGDQIKPPFDGSFVAFSLDGTQLISYHERVVTVESTTSRAVIAKFDIPEGKYNSFHLSPDGRLVAVVAENTINIWNIASSDPHLVKTLNGHTQDITTLAFCSPSTFISTSYDRSVRFWQIGTSLSNPAMASAKSISTSLSPIESITIQAKFGITITSHSDGMVKAWDISTGHCRASFQTPVQDYFPRDVQLINDQLILVWHEHSELKIWDVVEQKLLLTTNGGDMTPGDLRISGDGSQVFGLNAHSVCAWFIQTGILVASVNHEYSYTGCLAVVGSKVWTYSPHSTKYEGWDFGSPDSEPIQLSNTPTLPNGITLWDPRKARIINAAPRRIIFQLSGRFAKPIEVQCDGAYLVAGYGSGELLILDLRHAIPQ